MKLYYAPGACSLSQHVILQEAGLDAELVKVDLSKHQTESGDDYYAINPKGPVPALKLDDGSVLTENVAIALYLGDQKPGSGLVPAHGEMSRYHVVEWLAYVASELHKGFGTFFIPGATDDMRAAAVDTLQKKFAYVDKALGSKQYLTGDTFTVADAYCFAIMRWTKGMKIDISMHKNLSAYVERIAERPAVQKVMEIEGVSY